MVRDTGRQPSDSENTAAGQLSGALVQARVITGGVHQVVSSRPTVPLPYRAGIAPSRAASFQDRMAFHQLMAVLGQGDTAELTSADAVRTAVVSGLGGVGKTQLALHYADTLWASGELDLLVWVTAGSRAAILSSYARLAADLTGLEDAETEDGAQRLLEWLANTSARWLVVLDDLQSPGDLRELWPPVTPTGQVLVTTRRRDAAFRGHRRRLLEVGVYTPEEARAYLLDLLGERPHLLEGAADLTARLGYLPLALSQAGAYMLDRDLSCAGYAERLADRRRRLGTLLPETDELPDEHRTTVAATWSMSIEQANAAQPAGVARPLLEVASCLDPNGCPVEVFASPSVLAAVAAAAGRDVTPEDTRDGLACLQRFSLLSIGVGGPSRVVRVHALVQRAARDHIAADRSPGLTRAVADGLVESWPEIERDTSFGQVLRANAEALREAGGEHLWSRDAHPVLFRVGASLGENGLAAQAAEYFERLLYDRLDVVGPEHPGILTIRHEWAYWTGEAGDPHEAVSALGRLLVDQLRVLGPNHPSTLATRHSMARWRGEAGAAADAVAALEKLLVDQLKILTPEHPSILTTRHNIAHWRGAAGDPHAAAALLEELLGDQERILGPDHPHTLTTRHNIAHWHGAAGNTTRALAALRELLADRLRVLGPSHPSTLVNRHEIAYWHGESGSPDEAVRALQELLVDEMNVLGPAHTITLATRHEIAHWYGVIGRSVEATKRLHELLLDQLRTLSPDHPTISITRNNFALWSGGSDQSSSALAALQAAFLGRSQVLGASHPSTLAIRHQIAHWRGVGGDPGGAAEALEELLVDHVQVLGPDHPRTLIIRHNIAHWRGVAGDPAGAARALRELLAERSRLLGPDHPSTVTTRECLEYWLKVSR